MEESRERRAGVGNKAPRCARRRSVPHPAPGRPPSPGLSLRRRLRVPHRQTLHCIPLSACVGGVLLSLPKRNSRPRARAPATPSSSRAKLSSTQTGKTLWRLATRPRGRGWETGPDRVREGFATSRPPGPRTSLSTTPGCLPLSSRPISLPRCPLVPARLTRFPSPAPPARWDSPLSSGSSRTLSTGSRRGLLGDSRAAPITAGSGWAHGGRADCAPRRPQEAERTGERAPLQQPQPEPRASPARAARAPYLRVLARHRHRRCQAPPRDAPSPPAAARRPAPSTPPPRGGGVELTVGGGVWRWIPNGGRLREVWGT